MLDEAHTYVEFFSSLSHKLPRFNAQTRNIGKCRLLELNIYLIRFGA